MHAPCIEHGWPSQTSTSNEAVGPVHEVNEVNEVNKTAPPTRSTDPPPIMSRARELRRGI